MVGKKSCLSYETSFFHLKASHNINRSTKLEVSKSSSPEYKMINALDQIGKTHAAAFKLKCVYCTKAEMSRNNESKRSLMQLISCESSHSTKKKKSLYAFYSVSSSPSLPRAVNTKTINRADISGSSSKILRSTFRFTQF